VSGITNQAKIKTCSTWITGITAFTSPAVKYNTLKVFSCVDGYMPAVVAATITSYVSFTFTAGAN